MKKIISPQSLDTVGFWASAGCAIHCLALPLLLSVSAFSSLAFLNQPYVEGSIITFSVLLGLGSMGPSYFRCHRKLTALYVLAMGFSLIFMSRVIAYEVWEIVLTSAGAILVATALITNHRLCRQVGLTDTKQL